MSRRLAAIVAALLTAVAAAGAGPAGAADGDGSAGGGGSAALADPATAAALADATAPVASGSLSWVASPSEALAAASAPGASTSGSPALSLQAAASPDALAPIPVTWCWANAAWHQWGTWPYQQRITDTTYWCALYGKSISYRTTSVSGSGTFCGTGWTSSALISGGLGYPWFTMRSSAGFACPTVIPWITLHENRYEDVNRTDTGGTHEVGSG